MSFLLKGVFGGNNSEIESNSNGNADNAADIVS
jgi:hypothetical protein